MTHVPPFAEDLRLDEPLPPAPAVTIDDAMAANYLAITGDELPASLSAPLSFTITRGAGRLANPSLVLGVAIGQSTVATRRVIANLYYRDVVLLRQVMLGETLRTVVTPVAAAWTRSGTDRAKVLLDIEVESDRGGRVAHFQRLALIPVADSSRLVERPVPDPEPRPTVASFERWLPDWDPAPLPTRFTTPPGTTWTDPLRDTVSSARELVRMTLNKAAAHRDQTAGLDGRRLVYGGHTVALAQAALSRTVPGLLTVVAWRSCDHVAPVFEDDLLETTVRIDAITEAHGGMALVDATVDVTAVRDTERVLVLTWCPVLAVAREESTP
jgi:2-methylfumaryl-CoA hydratase